MTCGELKKLKPLLKSVVFVDGRDPAAESKIGPDVSSRRSVVIEELALTEEGCRYCGGLQTLSQMRDPQGREDEKDYRPDQERHHEKDPQNKWCPRHVYPESESQVRIFWKNVDLSLGEEIPVDEI